VYWGSLSLEHYRIEYSPAAKPGFLCEPCKNTPQAG